MRLIKYKTRNGEEAHEILTPEEAEARGLPYLKDYKNIEAKGDLILTDDGFVLEVLAYGASPRTGKRWIRTCIGTFAIDNSVPYVDTEPRQDRFTFSGKTRKQSHQKFAIEWEAFAEYLVRGYRPIDAYQMVYPNAKSKRYAKEKALLLMQKREVRKIVAAKLDEVFEELEINDRWLLNRYKTLALGAESDSVQLQAVNALAEIKGIKGQKNVTTTTNLFTGISKTELQQIEASVDEAPLEIAEGVTDDEDGDDITLEDGIF